MTRRTLASSSMRFDFVCRRPAVSAMTTSAWRATAASRASNTTARRIRVRGVGDDLGRRCAGPRCRSWSIAAARNVSAAASTTRRPSARSRAASLPMVVVLPVPLTPTTSTMAGPPSVAGSGSSSSSSRAASRRAELGARPRPPRSTSRRLRARSTRSIESWAPTSPRDQRSPRSRPSPRRPPPPKALAQPRAEPGPRLLQALLELLALALAAGGVGLLGAVVGAPRPLGLGLADGLDRGDLPEDRVRRDRRGRRQLDGSGDWRRRRATRRSATRRRSARRRPRPRRTRRRSPARRRAPRPAVRRARAQMDRDGRIATLTPVQPGSPARTARASERRSSAIAWASSSRRLITRLTESSPTVTP